MPLGIIIGLRNVRNTRSFARSLHWGQCVVAAAADFDVISFAVYIATNPQRHVAMGQRTSFSRLRLLAVGLAAFAAACILLSWQDDGATFAINYMYIVSDGNTNRGPSTLTSKPGRFLAAEPDVNADANDISDKSLADAATNGGGNDDDDDDDEVAMEIPQNVRLVLIGDSVTRYQYLSLAHFFRYGKWYDSSLDATSYLVNEKSFQSWDEFYLRTNMLLSPFEQCDCHRSEGNMHDEIFNEIYENRYFYDPARNNSVVYLQKFGDFPFQSHWEPGPNVNMPHPRNGVLLDSKQDAVDPPFFRGNWIETLSDFVPKLEPKPTHIVLNSGLWGPGGFDKEEQMAGVLAALQRNGMKGIYKTTTRKSAEELEWYEKHLCHHMTACLDMTFTSDIKAEPTWDHTHFYHGTYEKANKALLKEKLRTRRRVDENKEEARGAYEARQLLGIILDTNG